VLCRGARSDTGQDFRAEVAAAGVETLTVDSQGALRRTLGHARPECVLHHWWDTSLFSGPARTGNERWIAIGHAALPMPVGYDAYVVLSEYHSRLQAHLPHDRIHWIANGVDLGRFRLRPERPDTPVTIAMLSRLDPGRFPRRLLACLPPLRELGARLLIAGSGARRYEIEPELAQVGRSSDIRFVGPISSDKIPEFLGRADIGLHLTETHQEVSPLPILEMLAAGLPVVAEPKGCLPELITPGENGFLAAGEREIAERLQRLVRLPQLRRRMKAAARRTASRYGIGQFRSSVQGLVSRLFAHPHLVRTNAAPPSRSPV
jgi:glycosyltransferase involved in cell wall biosynthesis